METDTSLSEWQYRVPIFGKPLPFFPFNTIYFNYIYMSIYNQFQQYLPGFDLPPCSVCDWQVCMSMTVLGFETATSDARKLLCPLHHSIIINLVNVTLMTLFLS